MLLQKNRFAFRKVTENVMETKRFLSTTGNLLRVVLFKNEKKAIIFQNEQQVEVVSVSDFPKPLTLDEFKSVLKNRMITYGVRF